MSSNTSATPSPSQPLSQWAAIAVAAITALSAHFTSVGKGEYAHDVGNVVAFEEEQHEAIIDLRRKVTFLFKRVMELEVGGVKPPGPASMFSPPAPSDAGVEPDADAGSWHDSFVADKCAQCPECCVDAKDSEEDAKPDFLPPAPARKEDAYPVKLDSNGMPVWEPLNKKMEQKKQ